MFPKLSIKYDKLVNNALVIKTMCDKMGIEVSGVTKVFCGEPKIAMGLLEAGISILADSRIENLIKLQDLSCSKMLLRIPMLSQVDEVVKYADISLNSEISVISALDKATKKLEKIHKIILMIDLGDLREGFFYKEFFKELPQILRFKNIEILGIGTNLTCYGGVIPDKDNLGMLVEISKKIKNHYGLNIKLISGGNSSSLYLVEQENIPFGITNLRIGEAIVLGRETAFGEKITNCFDDIFLLQAEIIEIKYKPSLPIGNIGMDAFGNKPSFQDKGMRKRAIVAIGRQDVNYRDIMPINKNVHILGGSSDHLILDLTESIEEYNVGDIVKFKLNYGGLLSLMTSEYVNKQIE